MRGHSRAHCSGIHSALEWTREGHGDIRNVAGRKQGGGNETSWQIGVRRSGNDYAMRCNAVMALGSISAARSKAGGPT